MNWLQWYNIRTYVRSSIWLFPALGIVLALSACQFVFWLDRRIGLASSFDPGASRELLEGLAASIFALIVFVSSTLLLAVQLASAQLTPRVISLFFKDRVIKLSLALFVFTFTFAMAVALRISDSVPLLAARTAAYCCLLCLILFIYMIDHVGKFLRPTGVLRVIAHMGRRVFQDVYPRPFDETETKTADLADQTGKPVQTVVSTKSGVVLALNVRGLVSLAQQHDCVIEMVPQVGEFIAIEEPLFHVYKNGSGVAVGELQNSVAVGLERTIEQDPAFAFRIIVDIASKGLSPAINDPTTAVLAVDQIHRLLRNVGNRRLDEGHVRDAQGRLRFIYRTPDWEDFVQLAVTEIRHFGATSIQVTRRLRAMLENLIHTLPALRAPVLHEELTKLKRSSKRSFVEVQDRALAEESDSQGVGGKGGSN